MTGMKKSENQVNRRENRQKLKFPQLGQLNGTAGP